MVKGILVIIAGAALFPGAAWADVSSTFDTDLDGWTVEGDPAPTPPDNPSWSASGGNPDGHAAVADGGAGITVWWLAPAKFLGDQSGSYGRSLSYQVKAEPASSFYDDIDVILEGGGVTLERDLPLLSPVDWTPVTVDLSASDDWLNLDTSQAPTESEFRSVLASLTALKIRAEYVNGLDTGRLDNVLLQQGPTTPPPPADGDGDGIPNTSDACPTVFAQTANGCPAALAPPTAELGRVLVAQELSGQVLIAIPAAAAGGPSSAGAQASQKGLRFVPLAEVREIPVGSFLDTRRGTVRLTSARDTAGRTQTGDFGRGLFQVLQSRRASARGLTDVVLKGASFAGCRRRGKAGFAQSKIVRRLRANARGRFRTRGRHSAATVRGTVWDTIDRCDGTLTKVSRGSVVVRDFRRRRNIVVRAGKRTRGKGGGRGSYLARAR